MCGCDFAEKQSLTLRYPPRPLSIAAILIVALRYAASASPREAARKKSRSFGPPGAYGTPERSDKSKDRKKKKALKESNWVEGDFNWIA